jgi:hypothetical protein
MFTASFQTPSGSGLCRRIRSNGGGGREKYEKECEWGDGVKQANVKERKEAGGE